MLRRILAAIALAVAALALLFFVGPVYRIEPPAEPPALPAEAADGTVLERWIAAREAVHPDIVPGAEKAIVWAHADRRRTPLSIIYLHGYSATRQEIAPFCDLLAARLGANLFYTRLSGHGRAPAAMGEVTGDDWLQDASEALAIGRRIGERVLVVGTSTGGTLALWLAQQPEASSIAAQLLVSPNLGPKDPNADLLAGPWGAQLQQWLIGEEHRWQPANPEQAKFWTWRYPARALVPMMALVKEVRASPLEQIRVPTLVVYSPLDQVVSPQRIEDAYARLTMPARRLHRAAPGEDRSQHVLAGDILAPSGTAPLLAEMLAFIEALPETPASAATRAQAPLGTQGVSVAR
jgi:esterase/lipase